MARVPRHLHPADEADNAPEGSDDEGAGGPRSLSRLLGLFDVLADAPGGVSLAALSPALGSPKSSLLNLLRPLVAENYLLQDAGLYRLGPRAFRMASKIIARWSFPNILQPLMEQLAQRTQETVALAMLDRESARVTYVNVVDGQQPVRYALRVGMSAQLYCTAAGRLLLAYTDEDWREHYLQTSVFKAYTPRTVTDPALLRKSLEAVRANGYAISIGESMLRGAAIAAPVHGPDDRVVAALTVGAPSDRLEEGRDRLLKDLMAAAAQASGK